MSTATHIFKKNSMTHAIAYSPYGYCPPAPMQMAATGFNGERSDPVTYNYALGAGYRFFNPALMRFTSPDAVSPFGSGGLNPYCYCLCDPINLSDPDGRTPAQPWNIIRLRTMFPSLHKRKTSFQINLEEFDANISNYKSTLGRRHEFGSARSLVASPAVDEIPPGWDRIGIHGSSTTNKKSLLKSLDPKLIKPRGGHQELGRGFYVAVDSSWSMFGSGDGRQSYNVYTPNMARFTPGKHFDFSHAALQPYEKMQIVIRESAYDLFIVREARVGPIVRPRPYEAPF
ncbi:TPA: RHS repeat-associated core domain-containing protein [Pseudomonas putida]|nr:MULTISPECIES: RHS repeat-associated core domain-containing protein [Pseudomonas putida group]PKF26250.1 RHS repeat-associated core domain-containing protein [Pseudomonas hunanensis]UWH24473.1 RHS repeat-associated core domain-containing protein [Pseudomonas sp. HD6515]ELS0926726.1 RHS repeat-associated core domain-containing protein [Pseudomonas putida]QKL06586.1 hypothetical protein GEV41_09160 [Pseudomonas putida]QNG10339.1 hypothetical protein GPM17_18710 [Pseudomonas putida]